MKKFGLGLAGAVIGGAIGYTTVPGYREFAQAFEAGHWAFSYPQTIILHVLVGVIAGAVLGVILAVFLARRAAKNA